MLLTAAISAAFRSDVDRAFSLTEDRLCGPTFLSLSRYPQRLEVGLHEPLTPPTGLDVELPAEARWKG
jgi:hypothetical protein